VEKQYGREEAEMMTEIEELKELEELRKRIEDLEVAVIALWQSKRSSKIWEALYRIRHRIKERLR